MKPVIGINCDLREDKDKRLRLRTEYFDAVQEADGLPLLIPFLDDEGDVGEALDRVDGLLLTGGGDLHASIFGEALHPRAKLIPERRQRFDLTLAKAALARGMPVLGICMGVQLINVAGGGTLVQDIPTLRPDADDHCVPERGSEAHEIRIMPDSRLARIVGVETLKVNSTHHQAVGTIAPGFRVGAEAPDGIVEAIESVGPSPVLGVQWHPERLRRQSRHMKLFEWLIRSAGETGAHG